MKRIYLLGILLLVILILLGWLSGYRLSATAAIPWDVDVVLTHKTANGKALLFQEKEHASFGVAQVKQYLGFLYQFDGGTRGYFIEEGKPFKATGIGNEESFLVGVKTAEDSNISYIALGNHIKGLSPSDPYSLTLDEVKRRQDEYHLGEVVDHYALFELDGYTEENWTIRAFDAHGKLVADKLFGGDVRYIKWQTRKR